ncbi:MAG TPA: Sec-independent protein translocase protein TatB [Steroidobacteraceae bacterium]|jgi:Tat protein translocase TatB subunit
MFDIGFSEILVIFILALIVLGPEKLPRVVREVGRWVGRARAMARQFQEQLEDEVDVDRNRSSPRPEPVRPVGGAPPANPPLPAPEHVEPVPGMDVPWQTAAAPSVDAGASGSEQPPEHLTPGTDERGT